MRVSFVGRSMMQRRRMLGWEELLGRVDDGYQEEEDDDVEWKGSGCEAITGVDFHSSNKAGVAKVSFLVLALGRCPAFASRFSFNRRVMFGNAVLPNYCIQIQPICFTGRLSACGGDKVSEPDNPASLLRTLLFVVDMARAAMTAFISLSRFRMAGGHFIASSELRVGSLKPSWQLPGPEDDVSLGEYSTYLSVVMISADRKSELIC
ncbi:hypothetical protein B0T10DRAFT_574632 [Thelonectria olida]|uniref:Uncharacterized protein n=1 Tax=Thelonectria olida TaxID=1576542 RepID=A0A9P8W1V3_9HYPO|nr:hypothetical protein B0T10DRAFT_574632 [Thelonectria olida]